MMVFKKFFDGLKSTIPATVLSILLFRGLQFGVNLVLEVPLRYFSGMFNLVFFVNDFILVVVFIFAEKLFVYFRNKPTHPVLGALGLLFLFIPIGIEVRRHVDVSEENLEQGTLQVGVEVPFELKCYVGNNPSDEPILKNAYIKEAKAEHCVGDLYYVRLVLTDEGAKRIYSSTVKNVGLELSFFIDGVFVAASKIHEPIEQDNVLLPGEFSYMEAVAVAEGIMLFSEKGMGARDSVRN